MISVYDKLLYKENCLALPKTAPAAEPAGKVNSWGQFGEEWKQLFHQQKLLVSFFTFR